MIFYYCRKWISYKYGFLGGQYRLHTECVWFQSRQTYHNDGWMRGGQQDGKVSKFEKLFLLLFFLQVLADKLYTLEQFRKVKENFMVSIWRNIQNNTVQYYVKHMEDLSTKQWLEDMRVRTDFVDLASKLFSGYDSGRRREVLQN